MTPDKPALYFDKDTMSDSLLRELVVLLTVGDDVVFQHADMMDSAAIILSTRSDYTVSAKPVYTINKGQPLSVPALVLGILNALQAWRHAYERILTVSKTVKLDLQTKLLSFGDDTINLTEKEAQIIEALYHADNNAMTRSALLEKIWYIDRDDIETHTVETHIYRLRQKLGDVDGALSKLIETQENEDSHVYLLNLSL